VKVATFNINNINKRLDNLLAWLKRERPDVVSPPTELASARSATLTIAFDLLSFDPIGMVSGHWRSRARVLEWG
jgi:exodeoxyribonuclease-3